MKRSVRIRVLCLVVAAVVLSGAVVAAAVMGSPYETLKRAAFDALTVRNVTTELRMTVTVDGVVVEDHRSHDVQGNNSYLSYYFDEDGNIDGFFYNGQGLSLFRTSFTTEDGAHWYHASVSSWDEDYLWGMGGSTTAFFRPDERNSAEMRFFELLVDVLVGDLRNNITMTSENGVRRISATLTENQVPELVKAGVDVIFAQSDYGFHATRDISFDGGEYIYERTFIRDGVKETTVYRQDFRPMTAEESAAWDEGTFYDRELYDFFGIRYIDDTPYVVTGPEEVISRQEGPATRADYERGHGPLGLPMSGLVINFVRGEAEVDANGDMTSLYATGAFTLTNIFGDAHNVEIEFNARFSDIGTSDPVLPIPGAEQILTIENMRELFGTDGTGVGTHSIGVYFLLNADGSINADSITTTHPSEWEIMNKGYMNIGNMEIHMAQVSTTATYTVTE